MLKKYGKNSFTLRGYIVLTSESLVGIDNILLVKATMKIPGTQDRIMQIPIEAFGKVAEQIKLHNEEWVEVDGRLEGREYESKIYPSIKVFELKTLPMHQENNQEESSSENEDVPF